MATGKKSPAGQHLKNTKQNSANHSNTRQINAKKSSMSQSRTKQNKTKQSSVKKNKTHNANKLYKFHYGPAQKENLYIAVPLYLIVSLVPLVIYTKKVVFTDPGNLYWDGLSTHFDMFSYYKMVLLLLFTAAGLIMYLLVPKDSLYDVKNVKKRKYYIPLGIYTLLVFLSALSSEYKQVAFFGFLERYEGAFVLIAYSVIAYLAMNVFNDEKSLKAMFICLLASAGVLSFIGALQYFGYDIFNSGIFLRLITPPSMESGTVTINFPGMVYSTLYNPNYVGSYMAILLPVIAVFIVISKKLIHKMVLAVLMVLAAICWIGCDSQAGIIGAVFALAVLLLLYRRKILQYKWFSLAAAVLLVGGLFAYNFATGGSIVSRIAELAAPESYNGGASREALEKALDGLDDVMMDEESLSLVTEKGIFRVLMPNGRLVIKDEDDNELPKDIDDKNTVCTLDERFKNIRIDTEPENGLMSVYYNDYHLMDVYYTDEGLKSPTNRWLTYRNGRKIEAFGFKGKEGFASNRGYIWSRSIPLLKNAIFIGYGPDTFALYFPQYDFLSKLKYYEIGGIFVDKAHNIYLQTAINTGVLSLLAMLVLFGLYAVSSIKVLWREDLTRFLPAAGAACFTAFCGYLVTGLANDSVVCVAPVFWTLFGAGIAINVKLAEERKEREKNERESREKESAGQENGEKITGKHENLTSAAEVRVK